MFTISRKALLAVVMLLPLAGCQTTMNQRQDCKVGDWNFIGNKDGAQGFDPRFDERRQFCAAVDGDKIKLESAGQYQAGWQQGNQHFWEEVGARDGISALAVSNYERQLKTEIIVKNHTPPNPDAYQRGWVRGNADYWYGIGDTDGKAGHSAKDEQLRAVSGQTIGFNQTSYQQGWRVGNYAYWTQIGFQDAHDGVPDSELKHRAQAAQTTGVLVREDAYKEAWNKEIIEYWRRLGWSDATEGRDVITRRADAKARGLKFSETEYQQQWEQRLIQYWREAGNTDGFGQPNQLEDRMSNARRNNVFVIPQTRDTYNQAWFAQNAVYCSPDNAFAFGRSNHRMAIEVCQANQQNRARRAWSAGQDYEDIARKLSNINMDLASLNDRRSDAARRLERIEREIRRDQDDKNRVTNNDTANNDRKRERERQELREFLQGTAHRMDDLRSWEFRYSQQMQQIKRDIYRD
ncbi:DUF2799 domain-containing protein [Undibacterium sp. Xuan67W]|uniref:DUF2799 domain-containing protein n=1 Tax=Undibacterium sp. Xuan67W TaxID=3413057 RepID=UPI003BF19093